MNQLTVRGFDEKLAQRLREIAQRKGLSLNKAALLLLRRGAALEVSSSDRPDVVGHALDGFVGVWSEAEEREFLEATRIFEQIDDSLWP